MSVHLTRLYPPPADRQPLAGLCLKHRLLEQQRDRNTYIYSSFIMSLDGALAISDGRDGWTHPKTLADPRDLRLLCELMAQADCLITSGSYLRDLKRGALGNLLQLPPDEQYQDLRDYRARLHAPLHPAIMVVSRSLDFDLPPAIAEHQQILHVLTPACAPIERIRELRRQGVHVAVTQDRQWVGSTAIAHQLKAIGARTAYLFCGPQLNSAMLRAKLLRRLYLTWLHRLQGGSPLTIGSLLPARQAVDLKLQELYMGEAEARLPSFWLGCFEP